MKIAIDFDGTCVTHEFPYIGKDIGAVPILKELVNKGHKLILFTMRSDGQEFGDVLTQAIKWFEVNNIELYSIQKDIGQENWTSSQKCYAELYIDDASLGIPLIYPENLFLPEEKIRPYVDWEEVKELLIDKNIL